MIERRPVAALLAAIFVAGCASVPEPQLLSDGHYAMGTLFELTLYGADASGLARARDAAFAKAEALDHTLSRYRPDSDVGRINASAGQAAVEVHADTAELLRTARAASSETMGSFDVTIGPLVALWTEAAERDRRPSREALASASANLGAERIRIEPGPRVAIAAGMSLDLGGIAKGHALDQMRPLLAKEGVTSALLSFGQSSAWAIGAPPGLAGWRLLARAPNDGFAGLITLRDLALSVSGSLGQWTEIAGRRYGHVLDPRSGEPLTRRREALVVAPTATRAEILSKALLVLGEREGIARVEAEPGCEALLLDSDGREWSTSGWNAVTRYERIGVPKARDLASRLGVRGRARTQLSGVQRRLSLDG